MSMDKIRIRIMVNTSCSRALTPQGRVWSKMAYKLVDFWDNENYA